MSDLPEPIIRHHRLRIKAELDPIIRYCTEELLIPVGHLTLITRVPDYDQYQIRVQSGYTFIVSGQEIALWENDPKCTPER